MEYYHVKVQKLMGMYGESGDFVRGGDIYYIKCMTWDKAKAEVQNCKFREVTVLEVRDNEGKLCPIP